MINLLFLNYFFKLHQLTGLAWVIFCVLGLKHEWPDSRLPCHRAPLFLLASVQSWAAAVPAPHAWRWWQCLSAPGEDGHAWRWWQCLEELCSNLCDGPTNLYLFNFYRPSNLLSYNCRIKTMMVDWSSIWWTSHQWWLCIKSSLSSLSKTSWSLIFFVNIHIFCD